MYLYKNYIQSITCQVSQVQCFMYQTIQSIQVNVHISVQKLQTEHNISGTVFNVSNHPVDPGKMYIYVSVQKLHTEHNMPGESGTVFDV